MSHQGTGDRQPLVDFLAEGVSLNEGSTQGRKLEGVVARAGVTNRNNRFYSVDLFERVVNELRPQVESGEFTGELDHPNFSALGTLERTAFVFDRLFMEDDLVKFEARLLDTPAGRTLESLMEGGVKVGMSTRGIGSVKWEKLNSAPDAGEVAVIQDDYQLFGVDAVKVPSNEAGIARLRESMESRLATEPEGNDNRSQERKGSSMEIESVEDLRKAYPDLVQEIEEGAQEAAQDAAGTRVEELEGELETAQSRVEELEGELETAQSAAEKLENLKSVLGETADDEDSDPAEDIPVYVKALQRKMEQLTEQLEEEREGAERVRTEATIKDRFNELRKESDFAEILDEEVDLSEIDSVDALESTVKRIEKVARRAADTKPGQNRGKGKVNERKSSDDDSDTELVNEEMLRLAGLKA